MENNNNLGRWTTPTTEKEKAFFARHSGAITRYGYSIIAIQAIWGVFSFKPALALVESGASNATWLLPFAPIIVVVILAVLHNTLRQESLEIFSNSMDKDELTINKWWNYIIPTIVIIGLFALDVLGVTATLRDDSIDGKKIANTTAADSAIAAAKKDYEATLRSIATAKADDESAAVAPFASQLASAKAIRTYDAFDVAAKNRKIAAIENKRNLALAEVRKESATAIKDAESHYKAEKQRITGKADSTEKGLTALDVANLNNSSKKGWYVSTFFMLLFLLMNYKLVYLRVRSGIRINVQFTQLDATGSFFEKLMVVISNIGQRQGHRILVSLHKLGSWGTAKLTDFDGHVILEQSSYNGGQVTTTPSVAVLPDINNNDLNGGGTSTAPPPPPPLPPSSNGGGGDDGGGNPTPPQPTPPNNAVQQTAPQVQTAVATATRYNNLSERSKYNMCCRINDTNPNYSVSHLMRACTEINPIIEKGSDGLFCPVPDDLHLVVNKCCDYQNEQTPPTPSIVIPNDTETVVTVPESEKTVVTPQKTVTTVSNSNNNEFSYGDELLKSMKQMFSAELNNLKVGHGKTETIMTRLIAKSKEFDTAVCNVKATPKLRNQICEWVADNVQPVITEYLKGNKEGSDE